MNSMDMDQVMDVPDTPDRLAVCPNTDKSSDNLRDNVVSSRHREKGKELLTFQSFGYQGDNAVVDLTTPNRHVHEFGRNSPYDEALENSQSRIKTKESSNMNGFSCKEWKGKEKIEALENSQSRIKTKESSNMNGFSRKEWKGKEKIEDNVSLPRARGRKRLVRNGFISPHNIVKAKEQAGKESNDLGNEMSNSPSSEIEIRGLINEDFDSFLMEEKGKGVVRYHRSLVEPGSKPMNFSSRSPINNSEKVNITSHARNGLSKQLEGLSGSWRGKRSRTRKTNASLSGSSHAECSTSSFDDGSDVVFLGCSGEPSNGREPSNGTSSRQNNLDQVIEIDEDSPGARHGVSDARARQVEADEMLARELQEQLYNEAPVVGNEEQMDALMASALRQEDSQNGLFGGSEISTGLTIWEIYRQSLNDSSTVRRGRPSRVPGHSRISRLRNRLARHPYRATSQRNSVFPTTMDVDTRMRILETLEELSDMGVGGNFLPVQRDFNENDYEMLLALDENNHQHVGASNDQINGLPQSIVQSDNFEEACVICLEKPTTGDTVRHLPCLHKFHKDCIDPWLRRRTSCPVCKSSIT